VSSGIGNDRDLVGRFFAEHIQLNTVGVLPEKADLNLDLYQPGSREVRRRSKRQGLGAANVMAYLTLDPQVQESRGTLNYSANLLSTTWTEYYRGAGTTGGTRSGSMWDDFTSSLQSLWHNLDEALDSAVRSKGHDSRMFKIVTTQEQAPNPQSRVRLAAERDPLGMPRASLDWRLTDLDRHSIDVAVDELVKAFGVSGVGRLQGAVDLRQNGWPKDIPVSWHHCGTTRMSNDPGSGVTNADGRVHGIDNLYICGSSLFPTNGNGNPTLTIVALALRLAAHLRQAQT
jgi:choline dehydrogenase-like flavoprotein